MKKLKKFFLLFLFLQGPVALFAQNAYFIDGFHGGVWGHYPVGYTSFIVDQLHKNPKWNINLEIEPETWDRDLKLDPAGLGTLKTFLSDNSVNSRIEYVNPTYMQPYMFNIAGESIIRQFSYGMDMLRKHFPSLNFKTYSSEEPCFTSALPQILKSFGFQYASLKNPNTCWGGYTRAHGQELVDWVGPDGTAILTSPRYAIEELKPRSAWETIANGNSKEYIAKAFADGIKNPVGMCLQDAGWRYGPWLKGDFYKPSNYTTWRNYFENITTVKNAPDWKFSQEDVLASLVWGSQVLQKIAQQTRAAEQLIVQGEKIASMNKLENNTAFPTRAIDEAWRTLMLSQHHDCWIVPYNGKKGDTWADKVKNWTGRTITIANSILNTTNEKITGNKFYYKVYNTLGTERDEWITASIPNGMLSEKLMVVTKDGKECRSQILKGNQIVFKASVPAMGYAVFELKNAPNLVKRTGAVIVLESNGDYRLETDLYRVRIDQAKGGTIKSLIAKTLSGKEFVDASSERKFNELRGNFYKKGGFQSNTDQPAKISVLENGPFMISVKVESEIAGNPVAQIITMKEGQPLIECQLHIDWKKNEGIGAFEETKYHDTTLVKAFYNDKFKLLTLFPLAIKNQKVFKDAPFDVTESKLANTFFNSWDSIKNNIMLNWVDVVDADHRYGMTMFSDHTTSYTHGTDFPLGLNTQYSGQGLWGRNYRIEGATKLTYQLLPHQGNWQQALVSHQNARIKEPLQVTTLMIKPRLFEKSFIETSSSTLEISACTFNKDEVYVRIFNADNSVTKGNVKLNFDVKKVAFVNLDGSAVQTASYSANQKGLQQVPIHLKPFGITTLKIWKR
jgi:alpha-mannosidase